MLKYQIWKKHNICNKTANELNTGEFAVLCASRCLRNSLPEQLRLYFIHENTFSYLFIYFISFRVFFSFSFFSRKKISSFFYITSSSSTMMFSFPFPSHIDYVSLSSLYECLNYYHSEWISEKKRCLMVCCWGDENVMKFNFLWETIGKYVHEVKHASRQQLPPYARTFSCPLPKDLLLHKVYCSRRQNLQLQEAKKCNRKKDNQSPIWVTLTWKKKGWIILLWGAGRSVFYVMLNF